MEDSALIKSLIQKKEYKECGKILKNRIIDYLVNLINENGVEYEYTNIYDLIDFSEEYIKDERKNIARNLEYFSIEEDDLIFFDRMLNICKEFNIK